MSKIRKKPAKRKPRPQLKPEPPYSPAAQAQSLMHLAWHSSVIQREEIIAELRRLEPRAIESLRSFLANELPDPSAEDDDKPYTWNDVRFNKAMDVMSHVARVAFAMLDDQKRLELILRSLGAHLVNSSTYNDVVTLSGWQREFALKSFGMMSRLVEGGAA